MRAESSVRRQLAADLERRGLSAAGFSALVVCGSGATLDVVGRLVYAVRHTGSAARVYEYREAMPVSGSHAIPSLGSRPIEATANMKAIVDGRGLDVPEELAGAELAPAPPARAHA